MRNEKCLFNVQLIFMRCVRTRAAQSVPRRGRYNEVVSRKLLFRSIRSLPLIIICMVEMRRRVVRGSRDGRSNPPGNDCDASGHAREGRRGRVSAFPRVDDADGGRYRCARTPPCAVVPSRFSLARILDRYLPYSRM